jgi:hypothetical protein
MDEQREKPGASAEGFGSARGWWGIDAHQRLENRLQRFQELANGLCRAYSEACDGQVEVLTAANECVTRSFQGFLNSRRPDQLLAVESEVLSDLMKVTSLQIKAWSDLGQKIQGCYVGAARDTTSDIEHEAREAGAEVEHPAEQTVPATKQRTRRLAKDADNQSSAKENELREELLASTRPPQVPPFEPK